MGCGRWVGGSSKIPHHTILRKSCSIIARLLKPLTLHWARGDYNINYLNLQPMRTLTLTQVYQQQDQKAEQSPT